MRKLSLALAVVFALCGCHTVRPPADTGLTLPALFSDGAVLQQGRPVAVWGKAAPGTRVRVAMAGRRAEAMANTAGVWQAYIGPFAAGGPFELTVAGGRSQRVVRDVLVGEVWLCSGQSNMEMTLQSGPRAVLNAEAEVAAADRPTIRLFQVPRTTKFAPQDDCPGAAWKACSPDTVRTFSAAGYFFGRELHGALDMPIGLIDASRGASPAEAWTSATALQAVPEWRPVMDLMPKLIADSARQAAGYDKKMGRWYVDLDTFDLGHANNKAVWADPALDTGDWATLQTPGYWEDQGYPNLDGFAWYRRDVDVPAAWAGKALRLHLTGINDMDRAWFNGTMVGQFDGTAGFTNPRDYPVPGALVKAGSNTIAVRVYDMGNNGGFTGPPKDMHLDLDGGGPGDTVAIDGAWKFKVGMDLARAPQKPVPPVYVEGNQRLPTVLYNGMIAPLVPYGLRGAIWYQGEGNVGRARQYRTLFPAMINDWRTAFRQGDLPFLFVQLASFRPRTDDANAASDIAELRDAQARAASGPNTGMAVTIDIGDADNIHPRNKQDVGKRLALLALKQVYGKDVAAHGPSVAAIGVEGAVVLTCGEVPSPRAVRYAWADNPDANLCNGAGLPCAPFERHVK